MGRANRFLAARVDVDRHRLSRPRRRRRRVRGQDCATPAIRCARRCSKRRRRPIRDFADGGCALLVTGGSQGARVMSDVVPAALALLSADERARLALVQQARGEDEARVRGGLAAARASPPRSPTFFTDLPARIAAAHLVDRPRRRLDRQRTRGDRPALDPGAVPARARSGPGRQRRPARAAGAARSCRRPSSRPSAGELAPALADRAARQASSPRRRARRRRALELADRGRQVSGAARKPSPSA